MNDDQIDYHAAKVAHENSAACKNRRAIYAGQGHGAACIRLAKIIAAAMREARDN